MKKFALIGLLIHLVICLSAQNTTSRVTVRKGASLDVHFNQLSDYSNGITLNNYTELQIYFNDTLDAVTGNPANTGWQLLVKSDGDLMSIYSGTSVNINVIDLQVTGNPIHASDTYNNITMNGFEQVIASGDEQIDVNKTISISYDIGKTNPIDIVSNERFVLLLEFILKPKP